MFRVSATKTHRNPHKRQCPTVRRPIRSDGRRLVDNLMATFFKNAKTERAKLFQEQSL